MPLSVLNQVARRFSKEPEWLKNLRMKSFERFNSLPPEVSDLYVRHYEAPSLTERQVLAAFEETVERQVSSDFRNLIADVEHPTAVYVGKYLAHLHISSEAANQGIEFIPIEDAIKKHEQFMRELYERAVRPPYAEKYSNLIHAINNVGMFIKIPKNVRVSNPFRIVYILDRADETVLSKVVVVAEPNSSASVIEEIHGLPEADGCVFGHHSHLFAMDDSQLKHSTLQNMSHTQIYLANRIADAGRNASTMVVGSVIGGSVSKVRVDSSMHGDGATTNDLEIAFGDDEQRIDVTANLHHIGFGTQGRVIAKGVVKDKAKSIFKGIITIEKAAKNTSAYLAEHAMIMSPEARAYAIPSLEIMTDEVKATHSASVSQIDPEQVFYLMARGIPEQEARKMLALGFFEPVVSMIDLDEVRWGLRSLLEGKWGGVVTELFEEPEVTMTSLFGTHYKYRYGK